MYQFSIENDFSVGTGDLPNAVACNVERSEPLHPQHKGLESFLALGFHALFSPFALDQEQLSELLRDYHKKFLNNTHNNHPLLVFLWAITQNNIATPHHPCDLSNTIMKHGCL